MGKKMNQGDTSQARPPEKKWWYACTVFGKDYFKQGSEWRVDPLLGRDLKTVNEYSRCHATGR
jgi:hypothetical protein